VGEPDHVDFEHAGFPCIVHRNSLGAWCGYVGVPEGHPWFGQGYDDVEADVHGGLTYAEPCQGNICHDRPEKRFWLGFDCNHAQDIAPGMYEIAAKAGYKYPGVEGFFGEPVTYKDLAYVRAETEKLAEQAKTAAR
jgi:hypothetical protein